MSSNILNKEDVDVVNELIIDVKPSEIVIALLEDKQLVELSKEKSNTKFSVGDIYVGKVKKIMPGLNAAFVDVGYEKDAFLHYLDLGPQFRSQNEFLRQAMAGKGNTTPAVQSAPLPDIDKNGKIVDVLTSGQSILVQIAKEPISTKGPRLSSEISIAGRNLVLMPFANKVSVSQKIKVPEERERLRRLIQSIKPKDYGVIVRTVAKNRRVAVLDTELRSLVDKWETVFEKVKTAEPPSLVIGEVNRTTAILRDILSASFTNVYVNDEEIFEEIREYIATIAPEKEKIVKHYNSKIPIFEYFGINKHIKSLFGKTVTIKNGAYLIIEHTEALHVIDVNSGNRSKKDIDQETNALEVNLAAAEEIARQLRLRDMGGIIVIDFIDMHEGDHKQQVFEKMREAMQVDRTKHNILPLSKFGLMQITRQRVRPEMSVEISETCPTCGGTGEVTPSILMIDEMENNLEYILTRLHRRNVVMKVHPYVAAFLKQGFISKRLKWSLKFKSLIRIKGDNSFGYLDCRYFDTDDTEISI